MKNRNLFPYRFRYVCKKIKSEKSRGRGALTLLWEERKVVWFGQGRIEDCIGYDNGRGIEDGIADDTYRYL